MSEQPGNTGLKSQPKHYSKNPIPSRHRALNPREFLPAEGKIFTLPSPDLKNLCVRPANFRQRTASEYEREFQNLCRSWLQPRRKHRKSSASSEYQRESGNLCRSWLQPRHKPCRSRAALAAEVRILGLRHAQTNSFDSAENDTAISERTQGNDQRTPAFPARAAGEVRVRETCDRCPAAEIAPSRQPSSAQRSALPPG